MTLPMTTTAIITAAGQGLRMGAAIAKQFLPVLGEPLICHTVKAFAACAAIDSIIVVLPPEMVIQRLTADGYRDIYLAPAWAVNKMEVLNAIDRELEISDTFQGSKYEKLPPW